MRIGIDCRLGGSRHAGIGRYIENLIIRLPQLDPTITWVVFYHDREQKKVWRQQLGAVQNVEWVLAPIRHYTIAEQLRMPSLYRSARLDVLHVPHFNIALLYTGTTVITIHDLLWHEYYGTQVTTLPQWQYWIKYAVYRWVTAAAVARAEKILVPAETIKQTLISYFPKAAAKIIVTKEGGSAAFVAGAGTQSNPKKQPKKQLVYIGSLYPHKNMVTVINALADLPEYKLIIVGARSIFQDQTRAQVAEAGVEGQVEFAGFVPDEQLAQLLQESQALVQPSLSEGFGLTGIEAMTAGVSVIASDIPIFHEIYQDGALFFDPRDSASFVRAVRQLEKEPRSKTQQLGQAVAKQYSWDTMAEQTLQAYRQAV